MTELQFAMAIPLRNKMKHPKGFIYSCPYCGDHKKRAYLLISHDKSVAYCHNCTFSTSLKKLIEYVDPTLFEEYVLKERDERKHQLLAGELGRKKHTFNPIAINSITDKEHDLKLFKFNQKYFVPATSNKDCIAYANKRKFPQEIFETLYWNNHPSQPFGSMLIYPFEKGEYVYGFQGRRLQEKRFYNFSRNESFKIYNIFGVDLEQDVPIFESIIDSFHIKNSVAMCGSSLSAQVQAMIKNKVWVFDFDKTGINKALSLVVNNQNERVFIPPTDLRKWKDFNAMVCAGVKESYLQDVVKENTFSGISAISRLKFIKSTRKM